MLALAGVLLVAFLMLLKLIVSSGTLNGLILYETFYQSGLLNYRNCTINPILHVLISWINLDLGIEVCFYQVWMCTRRPGYSLCFSSTSGCW